MGSCRILKRILVGISHIPSYRFLVDPKQDLGRSNSIASYRLLLNLTLDLGQKCSSILVLCFCKKICLLARLAFKLFFRWLVFYISNIVFFIVFFFVCLVLIKSLSCLNRLVLSRILNRILDKLFRDLARTWTIASYRFLWDLKQVLRQKFSRILAGQRIMIKTELICSGFVLTYNVKMHLLTTNSCRVKFMAGNTCHLLVLQCGNSER